APVYLGGAIPPPGAVRWARQHHRLPLLGRSACGQRRTGVPGGRYTPARCRALGKAAPPLTAPRALGLR
ncbi:hypothetical protein, partial [Aquitalea pelogenes]|uniref:hypothetical protein n=1 Tax=Aquitalea pelogenes TaxID=1293573 RepID=UPI001959D3E5